MVRLVFTADNHLSKYYSRMTFDQLTKRRERLREAWRRTVDYALESRADLYLHGGDLFDTPTPRNADLVAVLTQLKRLHEAGVQVYMIGGNHDVPRSRSEGVTPQRIYDEGGQARLFHRFSRVEWEVHEVDGLRLAIGGLPSDPRLERDDDPLADIENLEPPPDADRAVLMLHYAIEGFLLDNVNEPVIPKASIAALRRIDLLLVGHVHERKVTTIGSVQVAFSGPTERMSFGELGVKTGFVEAVISRDGVKVRHHDIAPQPMRRDELRTTNLPPDDPTDALKDFIAARSSQDQLYQLRLVGPLSLDTYRRLDWPAVRALGADTNFYFDLDRDKVYLSQGEAVEVGGGGERVSARAEIEAVAAALLAVTEDDDERDLLREARDVALLRYRGEG